MEVNRVTELEKYVQDASCKRSDSNVSKDSTSRIAELAKPRQLPPKLFLDDSQEALFPKDKQLRIEKFLKEGRASTEELELFVKAEADRDEACGKRLEKSKERIYQNVLSKLNCQCRDQIMSDAVDKFANYMSEKCVDPEPCAMMTESGQSLTRGIIFNMYLSLGIGKKLKDVDRSLCERFATVLSNLISEALYSAEVGVARPSYIEAKRRSSMDIISEKQLQTRAINAAKRIVHRQELMKRKAEEQLRATLIDNLS